MFSRDQAHSSRDLHKMCFLFTVFFCRTSVYLLILTLFMFLISEPVSLVKYIAVWGFLLSLFDGLVVGTYRPRVFNCMVLSSKKFSWSCLIQVMMRNWIWYCTSAIQVVKWTFAIMHSFLSLIKVDLCGVELNKVSFNATESSDALPFSVSLW